MTIRKTSKIWIAVALIVMLACSVVLWFSVICSGTWVFGLHAASAQISIKEAKHMQSGLRIGSTIGKTNL